MLIIPIRSNENIDKALKRFKRKFDRTGVIKELKKRQQFIKPSVKYRKKILKAKHVQCLKDNHS